MNGFQIASGMLLGQPAVRATRRPRTPSDYRAIQPSRGLLPAFDPDRPTRCPGCGGAHWQVGRHSAECARCATALPLAPTNTPANGDH